MKPAKILSLSQIPAFAARLAARLTGGEVLGLVGPLGSGKTAFAQALSKRLRVKSRVSSPTFVIMARHRARLKNKPVWLYHLDLYRTKNFRDVAAVGLKEIWQRHDTIVLIEWAEKIKKFLPANTQLIKFRHEKP